MVGAFLVLAGFGLGVRGADKDVEELLGHMRDAYHAVKSVTFTCESLFPNDADPKPSTPMFINAFSYRAADHIRLDITSPNASDFKSSLVKVTDGKKISLKLPGASTFTEKPFSIDEFEANLPVNLESFVFWDSDRQLSIEKGKNMEHSGLKVVRDEEWNGKKWTVLEETATEAKVFCRYFVDPKSYFIWRTVIRPIGGSVDNQDSRITKLDTSAVVPDSRFSPP